MKSDVLRKKVDHWPIILIAGLLWAGLAGCGDREQAPDQEVEKARALDAAELNPLPVKVETLHSSDHIMVRKILLPTPAALGRAFYHNNPIFPQSEPAQEQIAKLEEITLDKLSWPETLVEGSFADTPEDTPLGPGEVENALSWQPLRDFVMLEDEELEQPLRDIAADIAGQRWGGPLPEVQNPTQIFVRNPQDPALLEFWVKIEFAPWAPVGAGITDSDDNGRPEAYAQIQPEMIDPPLARTIISEFMGRVWRPEEVNEFLEWFLGEVYNQTYATNRSSQFDQFPTGDVEDYVLRELGDLQVAAPDIVIRAGSEKMPKIYNVFIINYDNATPDEPPTGVDVVPDSGAASREKSADAPPPPSPAGDQPLGAELPDALDDDLDPEGFQARTQEILESRPAGQNVFIGYENWLFLPESLQLFTADPAGAADLASVHFLANISGQLEDRGIQFVYVSVPAKSTVNPRLAVGAGAAEPPNRQVRQALQVLRDQGVEVLDLTQALQSEKPGATFLKTDTHWNPQGIDQAAKALAEHARDHAPAVVAEFSAEPDQRKFLGDLVRNLPADLQQHFRQETVQAQVVQNSEGEPVGADNPDSPILILGDSYTVIFESGLHGRNAGLASQLARHAGTPVHQIATQGGGPGLVRDLARQMAQATRQNQDFLGQTRIIFFVMTERRLVDPDLDWQTFDLPPAPESQ